MSKAKKFYVVWEGHQPGIYDSWENCQREIKGYPNARFMGFSTLELARKAFSNPESVIKSKSRSYFYVVWHGHRPGIYTTWEEAQKNIQGFPKAVFKTFGSRQLAEKAFEEGPENYKDGDFKKTKDLDHEKLKNIGSPVELSLCVDAACNNKGDFEYKGVWIFSREEAFKAGPYKKGSNNIGEFLALVHALAFLKKHRDTAMQVLPIYSDSKIAMSWVRQKKCKTNKMPPPDVQNLIRRAEQWLKTNTWKNKILKWETKVWGEIPADFGRK